MHPVIYHVWGPFSIYSYGLCLASALFVALAVSALRARYVYERYDRIILLFIVIVASGLAGSYVLFILSNWRLYLDLPWKQVTIFGVEIGVPRLGQLLRGGMVYYGGLLGGLAGGIVFIVIFRAPVLETMDCVAPGVAMAHAWGRLGCFLAGCCYGVPCDSAGGLCVRFPSDSVAYFDMIERGLLSPKESLTPPLVPVQLIESFFELILAMVLTHLYGFRKTRGQVMGAYFVLYGAFRFGMEALRFDPYRGSLLFFSTSQWISIALVLAGLVLLFATVIYKFRSVKFVN
jgi:phosphatidylglycerol:prolipoprotein diacylglycerol transferase